MAKILTHDNTGVVAVDTVATANGGFGQNVSTGLTNGHVAIVATNAITIGALTAAAVPSLNASKITAGTLTIAVGGTGTSTVFTQGSVIFAGASGVYSQDNSRFFYDATNHRLGIGTATPAYALDVYGAMQNIYGTNSFFSTVSSVNLGGNNGFTIQVQGKYAYVTDLSAAVLSVIDITNPLAPANVGNVTLTGQLRGLAVQGNYAYVASASPGNLVYVVDISNPAVPVSVGSVAVSDARSIVVSGKYAYAFLNNGASSSIKVIDVSVPSSPTIVATAAMDNGVCGKMVIQGKYLYTCASTNSTISIYDISNPLNPTLVSGRFNTGGCFSLEVSGRYLYAVNTSGRIAVVDVSNPTTPSLLTATTSFNGNGFIFLSGRYLYMVSSSFTALRAIDVSDPANPAQVATITTAASPAAVYVAGRYAYLTYSTNPDKITITDLGGLETANLKTAHAQMGRLKVYEDADVQGNLNVGTGLSVGNPGIFSEGPIISRVTANILQAGAVDLVADQTTTSASLVDLSGSTFTITTSIGSKLSISASFAMSNTSAVGSNNRVALLIDGSVVKNATFSTPAIANQFCCGAIEHMASLSAGSHTVKLQWSTTAGTVQCRPITAAPTSEHATLKYIELSR